VTTSRVVVLSAALLVARLASAAGVIEAFEFADATQEHRYQQLVAELRCPKCLNTNLAGSDAPIAQDLRREVYRLITNGASDDEIRAFLQERYGDFVLYDPPLRPGTAVLWGLPFVLLVIAVVVIARMARRGRQSAIPLSPEERARLDQLVGGAAERSSR
jgi:cytochrome c-type biogenesis protein CcmH